MKIYQHPQYKEKEEFGAWLHRMVIDKRMSSRVCSDIFEAANDIFDQAGLPPGPDADEVTLAVYRQIVHVMKKKTIELCPHLADEVRNFNSGRSL